jgi:hypothetical protein
MRSLSTTSIFGRLWDGFGILLLFVLLVGNIVISGELPGSVSGYYYTGMWNVLVGALCVIGVFLMAYAGYDELDRWITNLAGLFTLGVAFFPTSHPSFHPKIIGDFHYFFAAASMISLALMAPRRASSTRQLSRRRVSR